MQGTLYSKTSALVRVGNLSPQILFADPHVHVFYLFTNSKNVPHFWSKFRMANIFIESILFIVTLSGEIDCAVTRMCTNWYQAQNDGILESAL